ncbi:MAG: PA14 domain-containing protein [Acidobacteriota bacterium]
MGVAILALLVLPVFWVWPPRGLTATYHGNTEWLGDPVARRIETRLTTDAVEEHRATLPQQQFSMLMVGWLRIDRPGEYEFKTRSDDGSTLDVAGTRVVDNGGYHAARTASGRITLEPGFHPIRLRYIQGSGSYSLNVQWTPPGEDESGIPPSVLYVTAPDLPGLAMIGQRAGLLWAFAWLVFGMLTLVRVVQAGRVPGGLRTMALRGLLATGSVVFGLLVVEIAMRIVARYQEDRRPLEERLSDGRADAAMVRVYSLGDLVQPSDQPGIVYELKPDLRGVFQGQPIATNSRGQRDEEYDYDKPPGTVRLVALGDSSLFGWGIRSEDTTPKVLERMLNEATGLPPIEVINFATPGYNTAIEADVFALKALRYAPDIVLINFNTNDYDVPAFMRLPQSYVTLRRSFLFDALYSQYERRTGVPRHELPVFDFASRTLTLEEADRLDQDPGLPEAYRYMVGRKGFEAAIDKLMAAANREGVHVVVFDARPIPGLHPTFAPNAFRDSQRETLERLSREKGFHWLNTYPYFVEYLTANPTARFPRVFAVSDTDSHPNELAHRINAQALRAFLIEKGWLSRD